MAKEIELPLNSNSSIENIFDSGSGILLHRIFRPSKLDAKYAQTDRIDISETDQFLQASMIGIAPNHSFRAHIHLDRSRAFENYKAQESWVIVRGQVEVTYFGLEGEFICKRTLSEGDLSITFHGGHGYKALDFGAIVYEFKTGPYEGQAIDKRFIDQATKD